MRSVGISELKQNVSRLVRTVQRTGEEVSVTVRGEIVAVLGPAGRPRSRGKRAKATTVADLRRLAAASIDQPHRLVCAASGL